MKVATLFLVLAFNLANSQNQIPAEDDASLICVERADTLKLLQGRDGLPGAPGIQGIPGPKGYAGAPGIKGTAGHPGKPGAPGLQGMKGSKGEIGLKGERGEPGEVGLLGIKGDPGPNGLPGLKGYPGMTGLTGVKGEKGQRGIPGAKMKKDMEISILNNYYIAQSGYFDKRYRVTSRELTDGRTDTGGWGSASAQTGNYIEATYLRPVYVTSLTLAGGYIPSWGSELRKEHGKLDLEYSLDGKTWLKINFVSSTSAVSAKRMVSFKLRQPITAQYWRLTSPQNKWVGTTEFALKPLIKP